MPDAVASPFDDPLEDLVDNAPFNASMQHPNNGKMPAAPADAVMDNPDGHKELDLAAGLIAEGGTYNEQVTDILVILPVQRPNKAKFFRIHPNLHSDIFIYKIKEGSKGGEIFAVYPKMVSRIEGCSLFTLFLGSHTDGSLFLWPVNAVSSDNWSKSSRQIAIAAMKVWCRLVTDQNAGLFVKREAKSITEEPVFPTDKTFVELLKLAFDPDHIVADENHRLVQELWQ